MIQRLPPWVEVGGFSLALVAGMVNAIALLGFNHQGVSHLSGSSTLLGVEIAGGHGGEALRLALIIGSFVAGAVASGMLIGGESLRLGRRYSAALFAEALLLALAMVFLDRGALLGHYLASAACGLQNAMASTFSGAAVRTTHVTGLFTDLGISLGLWLRGTRPDARRIVLYTLLIAGFILGGMVGAAAFGQYRFQALLGPAALAAAIGTAYLLYRRRAQS